MQMEKKLAQPLLVEKNLPQPLLIKEGRKKHHEIRKTVCCFRPGDLWGLHPCPARIGDE